MIIGVDSVLRQISTTNAELADYIYRTYGENAEFKEMKVFREYVSDFLYTGVEFKQCPESYNNKDVFLALLFSSPDHLYEFDFDDSASEIRLQILVVKAGKVKRICFDEMNPIQLKHVFTLLMTGAIKAEQSPNFPDINIGIGLKRYPYFVYQIEIVKSMHNYYSMMKSNKNL